LGNIEAIIIFFGIPIGAIAILLIINYRPTINKNSAKHYNNVCFYLSKYEYFDKLNSEQKLEFAEIIRKFINKFIFTGKEGIVVTDEMRITIAAGYAKLNMGYDFGKLYSFSEIFIFPHAYRDTEKQVKHLGKTSINGYISFSWEYILKGEANLHDGVNLALHEFSHALVIEMMQSKIEFKMEYFIVKQIYNSGIKEINAIKNGKEPTFRKYAYTSPNEFFAIAVEVFFELPEKLIQYHWKTYRNLCILLRQNPLKKEIGSISWKSILEYPHEPGLFNNIEHTLYYGPFKLKYDIIKIEVNKRASIITVQDKNNEIKIISLPHIEVLYATCINIPPTQYTLEEFHFIVYFIKNNQIENITYISLSETPVKEIIEIYREIGLV
jgi:Mlc titration factor MtfA (ptsG expression regulator)